MIAQLQYASASSEGGWRKKQRSRDRDDIERDAQNTRYFVGTSEDEIRRKKGLFIRRPREGAKGSRNVYDVVFPENVPIRYRDNWVKFYNHENYDRIERFHLHFTKRLFDTARELLRKRNLKDEWYMSKDKMDEIIQQLSEQADRNQIREIDILQQKYDRLYSKWKSERMAELKVMEGSRESDEGGSIGYREASFVTRKGISTGRQ